MDKNKKISIAILDLMENFLEEKGVFIENDEHEGDEYEAILYGSDYGYLEDEIIKILKDYEEN